MPATITPSLRSALERLRHAGAVSGICLGWRRQLLTSLLPFEEFRAERIIQAVEDARDHFSTGDRNAQSVWFGFDGVFVLARFFKDTTLVVLHTRAEEVDFLNSVAATFLDDSQLLINALINPPPSQPEGDTELLH